VQKPSLLDVYKFLPQTNCGECGEPSCMTFASKLLERKATIDGCPPLKQAKFKAQAARLAELIAPPIREVVLGIGERAVKIGGKEVLYRHELTFHNPTAIALDVSDSMEDSEIIERCKFIEGFQVERIGEKLSLNAVAVRNATGSPERFAETVALVARSCNLPMIICSLDPEAQRLSLEQKGVYDRRPLLYAATRKNWKEIAALANQYACPVVASSPNDVRGLKSLTRTLSAMGIRDIIIDPGFWAEGSLLRDTVNNLVMIRRSALQREDKDLAYPIIMIPAVSWIGTQDPRAAAYRESYLASLLIARFADLIIMHSTEFWALLPVVTLRQSIYTDPRKPVAVESGLRQIGEPDERSPVLLTSNFALTYYTVSNDLETMDVNCYLLVLNTEGLAVEVSVAGGQFNAPGVKDLIISTGISNKVKHRKLIIPGLAARLSGDIEDVTKWEVIVGPRDSSQIKSFLEKNWDLQERK